MDPTGKVYLLIPQSRVVPKRDWDVSWENCGRKEGKYFFLEYFLMCGKMVGGKFFLHFFISSEGHKKKTVPSSS